jgi:hypothetical protein
MRSVFLTLAKLPVNKGELPADNERSTITADGTAEFAPRNGRFSRKGTSRCWVVQRGLFSRGSA